MFCLQYVLFMVCKDKNKTRNCRKTLGEMFFLSAKVCLSLQIGCD